MKDQAENVTMGLCLGSHRAKKIKNNILIHPETEVQVGDRIS